MTQPEGWIGSRLLLKRLRDAMATDATAQVKLDQIVRIVAADMVAEVCSVYVMRAGEVLELFATEGLNPEAVHKTRLRTGEGLIGDIAAHSRALSLADAWSHPSFAYRPETGEDIYRSFMGVPIHRGGRVLGVLAVQNRTMRAYIEEEIEAMETIAMVLAELVASGDLVNPLEASNGDGLALKPGRIDGVKLNPGLAIGHAVLHRPRITIRQMVAEDPEGELARLKDAVAGMQSAIDDLLASETVSGSGEFRDVMESYKMFAEDRGWLSRIRETVRSGLTAEAAVQKVQNDMRARMREVTDPYLKERLYDLEDLTNRLLVHLSGPQPTGDAEPLPDDCILIARSMGPSELLDYDRKRLRALVLEEGSPTSHVAIVARAFDIPVVGRVKDVLDRAEPGDLMIVDGDHAQVYVRPADDIVETVRHAISSRTEQRAHYAALKHLPAITRDGQSIKLMVNAGLLTDVAAVEEVGADGIGLYRTEIAFMVRASFPDVDMQTELYKRTLDLIGDRPVVFRTLDVGGDKTLPYFKVEGDENPAMGWRAIRIGLDRPAMLRQQLRAMVRAAARRPLAVMFPMIAEVAEFDRARSLLDMELALAKRSGAAMPSSVKVGAMVEVPALMWQMKQLLPRVDFLSVGSNDLLQFLFASDRGSTRMADRYDLLSPPVLAFLRDLIAQTEAAKVPLTLCGEMAGRPLEAMTLLALGFKSISMSAASIGPVKMMTRSLEIGPLARYLDRLIDSPAHSVRESLRSYARDRGVVL
jgi:phosphotransferase system enzyme I (PtsP)